MIHVLQLLAELVIFLATLLVLLDYGPIDVHLLAAAACGGLSLLFIRGVIVISTITFRRLRRWWIEPPGQFWKQNGSWTWVDAPEADDPSTE